MATLLAVPLPAAVAPPAGMAPSINGGGEGPGPGSGPAGLAVRPGSGAEATALLRQALAERPDCVLLEGTLRDAVPPDLLASAMNGDATLFAVVPDVRGRGTPPDVEQYVRSALGIET